MPMPERLRALHVVVLGRMRLYLVLCAGTPIIYLLVFAVGPKAGAGLEASGLVGDVVARGMVRHSFVAERKKKRSMTTGVLGKRATHSVYPGMSRF